MASAVSRDTLKENTMVKKKTQTVSQAAKLLAKKKREKAAMLKAAGSYGKKKK